jgi:hypothetical protein
MLPIYAADGVRHLWLIDPALRMLEACENRQGDWLRIAAHADQQQVRVPPLDAVAIDLGGLWAQARIALTCVCVFNRSPWFSVTARAA